jgi:hypothetical protein
MLTAKVGSASADSLTSSAPFGRMLSFSAKATSSASTSGLDTFIKELPAGGLFGFTATADPCIAGELLKSAIAELKAIAGGATDGLEGAKKRVALESVLAVESEGLALPTSTGASAVTTDAVVAAAKAALAADPSYAVYGTTLGTPSFKSIVTCLK